jgi:hypothetical protein
LYRDIVGLYDSRNVGCESVTPQVDFGLRGEADS